MAMARYNPTARVSGRALPPPAPGSGRGNGGAISSPPGSRDYYNHDGPGGSTVDYGPHRGGYTPSPKLRPDEYVTHATPFYDAEHENDVARRRDLREGNPAWVAARDAGDIKGMQRADQSMRSDMQRDRFIAQGGQGSTWDNRYQNENDWPRPTSSIGYSHGPGSPDYATRGTNPSPYGPGNTAPRGGGMGGGGMGGMMGAFNGPSAGGGVPQSVISALRGGMSGMMGGGANYDRMTRDEKRDYIRAGGLQGNQGPTDGAGGYRGQRPWMRPDGIEVQMDYGNKEFSNPQALNAAWQASPGGYSQQDIQIMQQQGISPSQAAGWMTNGGRDFTDVSYTGSNDRNIAFVNGGGGGSSPGFSPGGGSGGYQGGGWYQVDPNDRNNLNGRPFIPWAPGMGRQQPGLDDPRWSGGMGGMTMGAGSMSMGQDPGFSRGGMGGMMGGMGGYGGMMGGMGGYGGMMGGLGGMAQFGYNPSANMGNPFSRFMMY